jgi:hypothetical protein
LRLHGAGAGAERNIFGSATLVVDPDPNLLAPSGFRKYHSGPEQLRIRNEFEVNYTEKEAQSYNFSTKMLNLKNSFVTKKILP